ncbi:MAG TPA: alpha/beta hydrolase [Gaiellaceae bacterium]|nr:alpha/beta hydrolase [Gaiellaceae bacterium]
MTLAVHEWGDPDAPLLLCLHGVTGNGLHFGRLAGRLADRFHVVAPDLLGHGDSPWQPPWTLRAHIAAIHEVAADSRLTCLGHSFGARLALELAAGAPGLVERLVLLDPAVFLPPPVALFAAEGSRADRSYSSFEEGVDRRYEESLLHSTDRALLHEELRTHLVQTASDGLWRYRYCQSAVIAAYSDLATQPPPFERVAVPTLLVLGRHSYLTYDHLLAEHRAALGDELELVTVDGGHTVLWDAFDEVADAVGRFLA